MLLQSKVSCCWQVHKTGAPWILGPGGCTETGCLLLVPEFEAEQDYMKTLSYLSPAEQKKHAARQAIAFMYQKPPGIDIVERKAAAQV